MTMRYAITIPFRLRPLQRDGVLQSCCQFLGGFVQAAIQLQDDIPDEQQLILLTNGDPPIPQVLLSSFEMCWRDDGSLTFAFVLNF